MTSDTSSKHGTQPTILVVEDHDGVRDLAVQMLKLNGFRVLEANNAAAGLAVFRKYPEIALVFTDVIMPGGVSGIELAKQILMERPDALILLATGYSEKGSALKAHAARSENIAAVSKPYDVNEIPDLINSMLARAHKHSSKKAAG